MAPSCEAKVKSAAALPIPGAATREPENKRGTRNIMSTTTITSSAMRNIKEPPEANCLKFRSANPDAPTTSIVERLVIDLRPAKFRVIAYHGSFRTIERRVQTWLRRKLTVKKFWKLVNGWTRWTMCCPRAALFAPDDCCSN